MSSKPALKNRIPVFLFAALLTIDVSVMIFEKLGAAAAGNAAGNELAFYVRLLQLPWTWLSIVLSPVQLLVWSKILNKTDLSVAYPISSLCFPLTMIASAICFHDQISWQAWLGGLLIASGIGLVGGEPDKPEPPDTDDLLKAAQPVSDSDRVALSSASSSK